MAVRVTDASGEMWQITDEEGGHSGEAAPSTVSYGVNMDGSENRDVIVIPCPVEGCGSTSYWPREALAQDVLGRLP